MEVEIFRKPKFFANRKQDKSPRSKAAISGNLFAQGDRQSQESVDVEVPLGTASTKYKGNHSKIPPQDKQYLHKHTDSSKHMELNESKGYDYDDEISRINVIIEAQQDPPAKAFQADQMRMFTGKEEKLF